MANFDTRSPRQRNEPSRFRAPLIPNRFLMLLTGGVILWFMLLTIPVVAPFFTLHWPIGAQRVPLGEAPNGKIKIAFVSDRDGHNNIYVMSADGSGLRKLTHSTTEDEYILRW